MPETRIRVVGSLNADRTMRVVALPAAGETTAARALEITPGGKGGNQATAAARAGARVSIAGAVGDDADGDLVLNSLTGAGVDTAAVRRAPGVPTGSAVILVDDAGENVIVVVDGANGTLDPSDAEALLGGVADGDLVLLQNEVPVATSRAVAALARERGARVIWNAAPAPDASGAVDAVDLLVVNEGELAVIAARAGVADAAGLARVLGVPVVTTLGPRGATAAADGRTIAVPAPSVRAVDTTAAGDTFVGVLAARLVAGDGLEDAMRRAAAAGGLAVTRRGAAAAIPTREEVDAFLDGAGAATGTPTG